MISRNFCKKFPHCGSSCCARQFSVKTNFPEDFNSVNFWWIISLLCCSKFLSSISWRQHVHHSKLIWRKIYDAPRCCCCHFQEIFRERQVFSNCAIHFMYLLCYDLPFAPVFYIQCFAFRRGNVWLMGNFNVP